MPPSEGQEHFLTQPHSRLTKQRLFPQSVPSFSMVGVCPTTMGCFFLNLCQGERGKGGGIQTGEIEADQKQSLPEVWEGHLLHR